MNELQLMTLENSDITTWNFSALKAELQGYLDQYAGLVYTDDTIKDARKDRATLNKAKKAVEDARKAFKAKCMEPYNALEPQVKELTDLIDKYKNQIDDTVKDYETRKKEARENDVKAFYQRASYGLGQYAAPLYPKLFNPKWTNATMSVAQYREEIQEAVASAEHDMDSIRDMHSPFYETLLDVYVQALSMDAVMEKNSELVAAVNKAGITETPAGQPSPAAVPAQPVEKPAEGEEATVIRIYASQAKMNQVCDFMRAIGVKYEVL